MSFTGFLKTFAKDLLKGVTFASAVAQGIDPLVQAAYPSSGKVIGTVTSDLGTLGSLITVVETTAQAITSAPSGANKLAAVLPYASTLIQQSELLAGKQVADEAGFEAGVTLVINGVVQILNSVKSKGLQNTQVPATVAALPVPSPVLPPPTA